MKKKNALLKRESEDLMIVSIGIGGFCAMFKPTYPNKKKHQKSTCKHLCDSYHAVGKVLELFAHHAIVGNIGNMMEYGHS